MAPVTEVVRFCVKHSPKHPDGWCDVRGVQNVDAQDAFRMSMLMIQRNVREFVVAEAARPMERC